MSDSIPHEWQFYLDDMIRFAEKIILIYRKIRPSRVRFQKPEL